MDDLLSADAIQQDLERRHYERWHASVKAFDTHTLLGNSVFDIDPVLVDFRRHKLVGSGALWALHDLVAQFAAWDDFCDAVGEDVNNALLSIAESLLPFIRAAEAREGSPERRADIGAVWAEAVGKGPLNPSVAPPPEVVKAFQAGHGIRCTATGYEVVAAPDKSPLTLLGKKT